MRWGKNICIFVTLLGKWDQGSTLQLLKRRDVTVCVRIGPPRRLRSQAFRLRALGGDENETESLIIQTKCLLLLSCHSRTVQMRLLPQPTVLQSNSILMAPKSYLPDWSFWGSSQWLDNCSGREVRKQEGGAPPLSWISFLSVLWNLEQIIWGFLGGLLLEKMLPGVVDDFQQSPDH